MAIRRRPVQDSKVLRRRRARRLHSTFVRLRQEATKPVGVFDASYFEWMLRSGKVDDAHYYLDSFLLHRVPSLERVTSPLFYDLVIHVGVFKTLAKVVAGGQEGAAMAKSFANLSEYMLQSPNIVRLHKMIAVMHADRTRASKLWEILKPQGLGVIMDLVARCPELQDEPHLPRERTLLCQELHGMPECPGCYWKDTMRASADVLFREFLRKRVHITHGRKRSEFHSPASCSVALSSKVHKLIQSPSILGIQWETWRNLQRKNGVEKSSEEKRH